MLNSIYREAVELLLASVYNSRGLGNNASMSRFLYGSPGTSVHDRRIGTEIWFRTTQLVKAALFIREKGPAYLHNLPMADIQDRLRNFLTENFGYIGRESFAAKFDCSYADFISAGAKDALAQALAGSPIFNSQDLLTLYPLVPIAVEANFTSQSFFLVKPDVLMAQLPASVPPRWVVPGQFPPVADWKGKKETPTSWLGVRTPTLHSSNKMKAAILGAIALTPHRTVRHLFTGRYMFGGHCTPETGMALSFGEPHTPALPDNIVLTSRDHAWLSLLSQKVSSNDLRTRRQMRALEYFYRGWPLDRTDRFPLLIMAIDALFSVKGAATKSVLDGVGPIMGPAFPETRLRLLLADLRASVIHGRAPEVYDAEEYFPYFEAYSSDPLLDLELIAARCLQHVVFEGVMAEHPHPHAELLKQKLGIDIDEL
jgi:hypothetical protein